MTQEQPCKLWIDEGIAVGPEIRIGTSIASRFRSVLPYNSVRYQLLRKR